MRAKSAVLALLSAGVLAAVVQCLPAVYAQPSELVMPKIAGSGELAVFGVWNEASCEAAPASARAISVQALHPDKFGLLKKFTKVEVIDLGSRWAHPNVTANALKVLAEIPSLRAINAWGCNEFDGNWLEVIGAMKQLRELAIGALATTDSPPRAKFSELAKVVQSAGIERLDLGRAQFDGSFIEFIRAAKCIKHLNIDNHYFGQRLPVEVLVELAAAPLECLEIESAELTDSVLSALAKNKTLTKLRLHSCRGISSAGLALLSKAPSLTALGFGYIEDMADQHVEAMATIKGIEVLDLSFGLSTNTNTGRRGEWPKDYKVSGAAFRHLSALPRLTTLIAQSTPAVTDEALKHISTLTGLTRLDICYNDAWTSKGIAALARCEKLTELRLDCADVHDSPMNNDVLKELVGLHALTRLSLTACEGATKAGFPGFEKMVKLRWLSVAGCKWVDAGFIASVSKLRDLEQLHLSYCEGVTDDGLVSLKGHKALRVLGVYGCGNVTDKSIELLKSLPQLSSLDLRRTKIFGDSAAKLAKDLADRQVEVARY